MTWNEVWEPVLYIGVDPGKSGAICAVRMSDYPSGESPRRPEVISKTNESYGTIWDRLAEATNGIQCRACIEMVGSMPGQGVSSTFKFGESYGMLQGLLTAARIPYELVRPAVWCKFMGLKKLKEETNTDWKNRHKVLALSLFPSEDITHATADAFLLAEYCRRQTIR